MTYDKFTVTLLSMLAGEERGSINALLARYLLGHAEELESLSVKELASACHVGSGTVSRFAREAGFADFAELREAFGGFARGFALVDGADVGDRAQILAAHVTSGVNQVAGGIDKKALGRLVADLMRYEKVSAYGLLKGQAAALDLQVDLLMQGKWVDTCTSLAEQMDHIASAGRDELIVLFSYSGAYFEYRDLSRELRRVDRARIWMVSGKRRQQPDYVSNLLLFESELDRLAHPFQLELVAGLIAQEYAAAVRAR